MTALAGILGTGAGLGLLLVVAGWRGVTVPRPSRRHPETARQVADRVSLRAGLAVGAAVIAGAITGWPVGAVLAGLGGWAAPSFFAGGRARTFGIARVEAVAGWAEMLRDTMAGAAGLEQAITATAPVAPLPIRTQVVMLAGRLETDRLVPALRTFATDMADPTCDLVTAALILAAEHQAQRLGDLLGSLATAARDEATMRLRVEAGRARTRTSVKVIVGVTGGLAAGLALLNRSYLTPYNTITGQLVLLLVGGLFAASFVWLARMTRPVTPARFLRPDHHASAARAGRGVRV